MNWARQDIVFYLSWLGRVGDGKYQGLSLYFHFYENCYHSNQGTKVGILPVIPVICSAFWLLLWPQWLYDDCTHFAPNSYHLVPTILGPPLLSVSQFCRRIFLCQPCIREDDHPRTWCRERNRTWKSGLCLLNYYFIGICWCFTLSSVWEYCSEVATACHEGRGWNRKPSVILQIKSHRSIHVDLKIQSIKCRLCIVIVIEHFFFPSQEVVLSQKA